jgi:23S rRNA pseudouridine1911/1915/1917 synthase
MTTPTPNPAIALEVLLEDPSFAVVAKPAGIVSEPGLGHAGDTVMNGAFARWGARLAPLGEARDHGLLHRLDRDTSGALVIALDAAAYDAIRAQFEARTVRKRYLAIVDGKPPRGEGTIDLPLEEVRRGDMKVSMVNRRGAGRPAITRWRTLASAGGRALLDVAIETGRLHQIRAHMAELGCPVLGDRVYRVDMPPNTSRPPRGRAAAPLALHAASIAFAHPATGAPVEVTCPVPGQFAEACLSAGLTLPRAFAPTRA